MPTGKSGIGFGSGKPDYAVNAIYSGDFGAWHTDINLLAARLGQADPGASRTLWLFAASLSRQLDDHWGVVGEFADTRPSGAEDSRQLLLAAQLQPEQADDARCRRGAQHPPRRLDLVGLHRPSPGSRRACSSRSS